MNAPYAVIMNGTTASLKTYTARRIANSLKIPLLETNKVGRCTNSDGLLADELRDRRYDLVTKQAKVLLEHHVPLVVDGTFNFQRWRKAIYAPLAENDITDVIIVSCVCDDVDIVQARIGERAQRKILPENEAARMDNYLKTIQDNEPVYKDTLLAGGKPAVIEFRTGPDYTVKIRQGASDNARMIRELIWHSFHTGRLNEH
jgi:predicted kinase